MLPTLLDAIPGTILTVGAEGVTMLVPFPGGGIGPAEPIGGGVEEDVVTEGCDGLGDGCPVG